MVKLLENFLFPTSQLTTVDSRRKLAYLQNSRILDVAMTAEYDKELNNSCFNQLPFELSEYPNQFFCSPKQVVSEIHFLNCLRNMLWPLASNWRHIPRQLENLTHKFIDFYIFVSTGVSYLDMLIGKCSINEFQTCVSMLLNFHNQPSS